MSKKQITQLSELAKKHGYEPGVFVIKRLAEMRAQIEEWESYLEAGTKPPHLLDMNDNQARNHVRLERADLAKLELELLPYFFPKLKSMDLGITGELSLLDVLKSERTRNSE